MPYIDKTNYLRGLQCRKLLWHAFHQPEAIPAPDASAQAVFEQGRELGRLAQRLFPDGIDLGQSPTDLQRAVVLARQALNARRPVYEATFASDHAFARIDILVPVGVERWDLYEVKGSTSAKSIYLNDIAFQVRVLRDAGLNVRRAILIYINNSYTRNGNVDVDALLTRQDVTGLSCRDMRTWFDPCAPAPHYRH